MRVLVVNAGSSSLKLRLLDDSDELVESADLPSEPSGISADNLVGTLQGWAAPDVVGHRIVHGGGDFVRATRINGRVERRLAELSDLAPLHQPKSLSGLAAISRCYPDVPAVACFDTAFHTTIPPAAATYAIPAHWRSKYGIRRYGFHGLSHAYASRRATELLESSTNGARFVVCHLGAGASLCAVVEGRSVDTTMGFTPLEGLVMATRSGSVDPGLVLWLEEHEHLSPHEVATALEHRSGLLALAGTSDMREIEARAAAMDPQAELALAVYVHRLTGGIASMVAAACGVDALVFTGGVGEKSSLIRSRAAERLAWLGAVVDADLNRVVEGDGEISAPGSNVHVLVVRAREDLEIAREAREVMST